jgi:hypothetical protein
VCPPNTGNDKRRWSILRQKKPTLDVDLYYCRIGADDLFLFLVSKEETKLHGM